MPHRRSQSMSPAKKWIESGLFQVKKSDSAQRGGFMETVIF